MGQNYTELKNECFMKQVDKDRFSLRIRLAGGNITTQDLRKVYELAEKFGQGYIHLTSRQCIEIPFIKYEDIDLVKSELVQAGLRQGACGAKVRTITACQGQSICLSGLIETSELAAELDALYYGRLVPHKFKIGITGCRNNCLKAEENDLGVKGAMEPAWGEEDCNFCGLCERKCLTKAIKVNKLKQTLEYNKQNCLRCGKCVKTCPQKAWQGKSGFIVYFGGLFGNNIQIGRQLIPVLFTKEELHAVIESTIAFYNMNGNKGERLGHCLNRVGWKGLEQELETWLAMMRNAS